MSKLQELRVKIALLRSLSTDSEANRTLDNLLADVDGAIAESEYVPAAMVDMDVVREIEKLKNLLGVLANRSGDFPLWAGELLKPFITFRDPPVGRPLDYSKHVSRQKFVPIAEYQALKDENAALLRTVNSTINISVNRVDGEVDLAEFAKDIIAATRNFA
jgi:hypothetical protein